MFTWRRKRGSGASDGSRGVVDPATVENNPQFPRQRALTRLDDPATEPDTPDFQRARALTRLDDFEPTEEGRRPSSAASEPDAEVFPYGKSAPSSEHEYPPAEWVINFPDATTKVAFILIDKINHNDWPRANAILDQLKDESPDKLSDVLSNTREQEDLFATPLIACARYITRDGVTTFKKLLDSGADPNKANYAGVTPLMYVILALRDDRISFEDFKGIVDHILQKAAESSNTAAVLYARDTHDSTVGAYAGGVPPIVEFLKEKMLQYPKPRTAAPS